MTITPFDFSTILGRILLDNNSICLHHKVRN